MTHTQVDLRHDGDLDLQHDGVGDGDLNQNFDMLSLLQHLVDVMEARIKQVSQIFQKHQSSLKDCLHIQFEIENFSSSFEE